MLSRALITIATGCWLYASYEKKAGCCLGVCPEFVTPSQLVVLFVSHSLTAGTAVFPIWNS